MQILGKRSKVMLIAVAIVMLIAIGVSFAMWDVSAVKATNGDVSQYANAKVGDVITFGKYYQTGEKDSVDQTEYKKTPIEWIVVDKDERTGQLTLLSKKILVAGSYFGNWYYNTTSDTGGHFYKTDNIQTAGNPYNQAYVDSTARAFLNNLERLDMGGDSFDATKGYIPSAINSTKDITAADGKFTQGTGLLSSAGFSNQRYWTGYTTLTAPALEGQSGIYKKPDVLTKNDEDKTPYYEFYYQRPIKNDEYKARPATRGFFDEAFTDEQKSMIVPKQIAGYTGHRWPANTHDIATKSYIEGALDKVWLPSATELNIASGVDWNGQADDAWTNPSDEAGSTVFEYFKNYNQYTNPVTNIKNTSVADAIKTVRTDFVANDSKAMNYSIPVYKYQSTEINDEIHTTKNSLDYYWTRSPSSHWFRYARLVDSSGLFGNDNTYFSCVGVRPCVMLKY